MDAFVSRKRKRLTPPPPIRQPPPLPPPPQQQLLPRPHQAGIPASAASAPAAPSPALTDDADSTDLKLAILSSLHPSLAQDVIFEALVAADGSVQLASDLLNPKGSAPSPTKKLNQKNVVGYQSSLSSFSIQTPTGSLSNKSLTRKGKTLYLYSPDDIATHTPCTIIHNFLPKANADALLQELVDEAPSYRRDKFKLFDRVVETPHSFAFYVDTWEEVQAQKTQYFYNGGVVADVRKSPPEMLRVRDKVQTAVNDAIADRIRRVYPAARKLLFQDPDIWKPNASFVNCYDGPNESVGYHSDQLTYLGPRAVIGSLSLGVAREFRVRRVVGQEPQVDADGTRAMSWVKSKSPTRADAEGQISIHLPHNSLLIMHAEMQEEWKHSIAPAQAIDPHPLAGNKRLNITYRYYKDHLHPRCTPRCGCGLPTVLRCSQRVRASRGRYMWMCGGGYAESQEGCAFFKWAEFDEDGRPPWAAGYKGNANIDVKSDS